jgi:hypothetical protein
VSLCSRDRRWLAEVDSGKHVSGAAWNSINVVEAIPRGSGEFTYRLTTSLVLEMTTKRGGVGVLKLAGTLNRKSSKVATPSAGAGKLPDHVAVWGPMIEAAEGIVRESLDTIYITKTRSALNAARSAGSGLPGMSTSFVSSLNAAVLSHGKNKPVA